MKKALFNQLGFRKTKDGFERFEVKDANLSKLSGEEVITSQYIKVCDMIGVQPENIPVSDMEEKINDMLGTMSKSKDQEEKEKEEAEAEAKAKDQEEKEQKFNDMCEKMTDMYQKMTDMYEKSAKDMEEKEAKAKDSIEEIATQKVNDALAKVNVLGLGEIFNKKIEDKPQKTRDTMTEQEYIKSQIKGVK